MPYSPPQAGEYAGFYQKYIDQLPEGNIIDLLHWNEQQFMNIAQFLSPEKWDHAYSEGKWTVKQLVLHMIDTERVMAYRAMCIARGDSNPFPGFDQDAYVAQSGATTRLASDLIPEYQAVRAATRALFRYLPEGAWSNRGMASGNEVTVRALAAIIVGHELHHMRILREKYLEELEEQSMVK